MAKQIQKFADSLGNEYNTAAEADAADQYREFQFAIRAYNKFAGLQKAQAGLMRAHLAGWEAFKQNENFNDLVEAAKVEAAEEEAAEKAAKEAEKAAAKAKAKAGKTEEEPAGA